MKLNHGMFREGSVCHWEAFREMWEEEKLPAHPLATRKKAQYVFDRFERHMKPSQLSKITKRTMVFTPGRYASWNARPARFNATWRISEKPSTGLPSNG